MSDFLSNESWGNLVRGHEYLAAIMFPSDTKRPLSFFIPDEDNPDKGELKSSIGDFSPDYSGGFPRAVTQQIVVSLKPRNVVIITSDEINASQDYEYVLVAPIHTIKEHDKSKNWYNLLKNNDHPIFSYLPNGNMERYVDLSQTTSIHKSLILQKKKETDPQYMEILEENLLQCLSLGIFEDDEDKITD